MKAKLFLGASLFLGSTQIVAMNENAADKKDAVSNIVFVAAEKGEDLSGYKELVEKVYSGHTKEGSEDYTRRILEKTFPVLAAWAGQKGKRFVKVLDGEKPVGFTTLKALTDDETHIAMAQSPLLPEYAGHYAKYLTCVKAQFPNATKVSVTCSSQLPKLQAVIEKFGFKPDDSYKGCEELSFAFTPDEEKEITGYTRELE